MNKSIFRTLSVVLYFSFFLFIFAHVTNAAEMGGMQDHQHIQHMHNMPAEETLTAGLQTKPDKLTAGSPATLILSIRDSKGKPVKDLSIVHDRILHVIIASEDFSVFSHIHPEDFGKITPEMKNSARYPVKFTFPKAGRYIIGIDFAAKDRLTSKHFMVEVAGGPKAGAVKKDLSVKKSFGDIDVTLSQKPAHIKAGGEASLTYSFSKNGKSVTDLSPYLSAPMHVAIISEGLRHFMHTHGELPGMAAMAHGDHMQMKMSVPEKFGPEIEVHAVFPTKGLYQIFGQVRHEGKVIDTSFMVEVE